MSARTSGAQRAAVDAAGAPEGAGSAGTALAALEQLRGAFADRTVREYAKSFALFERWCRAEGRDPLPASPETVAGFIESMAGRFTLGTIGQHAYAVRRIHLTLGLADPLSGPAIKIARRRCRMAWPAQPRQAAPLTREMCARLLSACPPTLRGKRDRALIRLGFDTLCRGAELGALRIEDLKPRADGSARIFVRRAKNDPFGEGAWAYVSAEGLRDVQAWLAAAGLQHGLVLRRFYRSCPGERALTTNSITLRLRSIAAAAGFAPDVVERLSSHSFRVGAVQALALEGRSIFEIMRAGRWKNVDALADYLRDMPVNIWAHAPEV